MSSKKECTARLETMGVRIRTLRQAKRMTQSDLASRIGVSSNFITMIENGKRTPSLDTICALADNLDSSSDYILGRSCCVDFPDSDDTNMPEGLISVTQRFICDLFSLFC